METFAEWLEEQIKVRGWRPADLANQAGIEQSTVSRILSGSRGAGPDACNRIAEALGIDYVIVYRRAGIIPPGPDADPDPTFFEMWSIMKHLTPDQRERVINFARYERFRGKAE